MSAPASVAPARASSSETARPIPCAAPVTSAILPCKSAIFSLTPARTFPRPFVHSINGRESAPCPPVEFSRLDYALCLPFRIGYVVDSRTDSLVLVERYPVHPARIPALGFRLFWPL